MNLSKITALLRLLLSKDAEWSIQKPQLDAINTLKEILTTAPIVQFCNSSLPARVSCDASCHGMEPFWSNKILKKIGDLYAS